MKLKSTTQLMIVLLGALSLAIGTAVAGGDKKLSDEQKDLMSQLDINQDGVISKTEAQRHPELAERFRQLDRNGNEQLEEAEFAQFEVEEDDPETGRNIP